METEHIVTIILLFCLFIIDPCIYMVKKINNERKKKKTSEWSNYFQLPQPYNHFNSTTNTLGIGVKYEYSYKKSNR